MSREISSGRRRRPERPVCGIWVALAPAMLLAALVPGTARAADEPAVSFSKDVAPILLNRCQGCHGPEKVKGDYRVDTFDRLMTPGTSESPPVVAGKADQSLLYRLLATADADDRMPKKADPLPSSELDVIRRWIETNAAFDGPDRSAPIASLSGGRHPSPPVVYPRPVPVMALAFSPDGKTLAAGGYHEVALWDAATGELRTRIDNLPQRIHAVDFSPDGSRLAVAGGSPGASGEVRVVDVGGEADPRVLDRTGDLMLAVRFSPDGKRVAAGGTDNLIRVYDAASGARERIIEQHADWVLDVAFSPDGKRLASASRDKSARVFDAATGEMLAAFLDHGEPVFGVAWSGDGQRCFSVGRDRKLRSWTADDGKNVGDEKKDAKPPSLPADPMRVATAGERIFVAGADGVVRGYERAKREAGREYVGLQDWAYALAVHPGSGRVAAASHAGEVRVWAVEDGKEIARFVAAPGYKR